MRDTKIMAKTDFTLKLYLIFVDYFQIWYFLDRV